MLLAMREDSGLTQIQVAEQIGKPQSHVSKYENGDRGLEMHEIREICIACGLEFAAFAADFDERLKQAIR